MIAVPVTMARVAASGVPRRRSRSAPIPSRSADDLEVTGHVAQDLGDGLAHLAQVGAAARATHARRHVDDVAARQLGWQLATLLLLELRVLDRLWLGVRRFRLGQLPWRCDRFRFRGFGFFQRQFKLLDGALDFLRTRTEL
jgi:hypothetical protein